MKDFNGFERDEGPLQDTSKIIILKIANYNMVICDRVNYSKTLHKMFVPKDLKGWQMLSIIESFDR